LSHVGRVVLAVSAVSLDHVSEYGQGGRSFSDAFDREIAVGPEEGNHAFFGRNVLRGLIDGMDDFIHVRQPRWEQFRSLGPALLGSAMWIDDPELIDKLGELSGASIVVTKQGREPYRRKRLAPLHDLNGRTPGLPIQAFAALSGLAPKVNGEPIIVGPYDRMYDGRVPTIRTLGYRRLGDFPPIMHAKLVLLGHLWWHDEDPLGHVEDVIGFTPRRLWVSSANFTSSSRRSLEFGYWTEDRALMHGAEDFLVSAMRFSEGLDPDADSSDPDLAGVRFDEAAMAEAAAEMRWHETDDEDDEDDTA
jgi:hypothetical protein